MSSGDADIAKTEEIQKLKDFSATVNTPLSEQQAQTLIAFGEYLAEVNKTLNLTRIPTSEYLSLHVMDSLSIAGVVELRNAKSLLDVGTGAGFPAVPLAVAYPKTAVTAMDARNKKLSFIADACARLGIRNVTTLHARAEQLAEQTPRRTFDVVTSRALADYSVLIDWQLPFVAPGGCAVMLKSVNQAEEISEPPQGWKQRVVKVEIPSASGAEKLERLVVVVERAA